MEMLALPTGATLACTDTGRGRPLLLLHGVCMSQKFFERNIGPLARTHRVIALDFRGYGDSPAAEGGHTVPQYARDVRAVIERLGLRGAVAVGWSMGGLAVWDYLAQFAADPRLAGAVIVSQGPSDLTQPGWPYGIADVAGLRTYLEMAQDDFEGFFAGFVPEMFASPLTAGQQTGFLKAICAVGPNAGTVILANQTLQDYRARIGQFTTPHLLVWGRDEKVGKLAAADWLHRELPSSELHVFEESGHCPMWEEPEKFNALVTEWAARLAPSPGRS
jgi:pimeloyl-ACP methyl ester carboxylesterase